MEREEWGENGTRGERRVMAEEPTDSGWEEQGIYIYIYIWPTPLHLGTYWLQVWVQGRVGSRNPSPGLGSGFGV